MKHLLVLHLGSNIGDRFHYLNSALHVLEIEFGKPLKTSGIYETKAWGNTDQPDFLNMVVVYLYEQMPEIILQTIKTIEKIVGRQHRKHWSMREIDIDILFYGNEIIKEQNFEIPHVQMHLRRFVLQPLAEIIPNHEHPVFHKTVNQLLAECPDHLEVKIWNHQ